ncbi:hypothetical protein APY04_0986 [Hyphomicrobium sulfonivorans]|uniref:Uncharacterized protein n=1 Tax=Hyphomicrobium sulfonivorans TaxID=121290 RepID=A0A120CX78_HYPSL|nr:hypothetical protein APY04_0986 [Hyphomicrobium sulfonivorans]
MTTDGKYRRHTAIFSRTNDGITHLTARPLEWARSLAAVGLIPIKRC